MSNIQNNKQSTVSRRALFALATAALVPSIRAALAQDFPTRSLRLVVAWPPGGTIDTVSRLIAQDIGERNNCTIVVENRAGAGGTVGAEFVAKSAPDGYTLLVSNVASHGIAPSLYPSLSYDAVNSFTHIGMFGAVGNVLLVGKSSPIKSLDELLAKAKASPGRLTIGSAGNGSSPHLSAEMMQARTGISLTHVPYRGASPARTALLAGEIDLLFENIPTAVPYIRQQDVRPLLVTSEQRSPSLPDVATARELGVHDLVAESWYGLSAPKGLPPQILARLSSLLVATLNEPAIRRQFSELDIVVKHTEPADYTAYIASEVEKWREVVKFSGAVVN